MDPVIDNEWLACKNDPVEEPQSVGNIARSWQWRERGIDPPSYPPNKTVLENIAEDILVQKPLKIRSCDLPGYPRSTFLMVFSPDGTKVASTHGNHNVYVSELASGKHVRILKGHPRTPWCIAFHPSHPQLIGSGCLGGQVRVWDISSGGSEVWNVRKETVIASIAFHPREQLLVIATYNELYFWDWSQPAPFTRVCTNNINEKVRYVAFDTLGYKLITGISLCATVTAIHSSLLQQNPLGSLSNHGANRREDDDNAPAAGSRPQENNGSAQDMIVNSYQNLVQRYDSLVRNYQRLFMVRHRLTNTPPPNTIDRGTDPMETDVSPTTSGWTRRNRPSTSALSDDGNPEPGPSRLQDGAESGDGEGSSSRLLNLDVLSIDSGAPRNITDDSPSQEHSIFGSRPSAFQPLTEGRSFRTVDQNERSTRLLPNPFSSSSNSRPDRSTVIRYVRSQQPTDTSENASRTSIFTSSRQETSPERSFLQRRRNSSPTQNTLNTSQIRNMLFPEERSTSNLETNNSLGTNSPQPAVTNSSTQMSPMASNVDAQAINESLDLIRDILRDSGTRLLNLITNMSMSTLYNVQRVRRADGSRGQSDDNESDPPGRSLADLFHTSVRDDFLSTSSESDSDQSLEVNILRTRNATFDRENLRDVNQNGSSSDRQPTDRMVFVLNDESPGEGTSRETGGINVSLSNSRFHVRTQSNSGGEEPGPSNPATSTPSPSNTQSGDGSNDTPPQSFSSFNPNRPSTSRDGWPRNVISSEEAYRKVRIGVNALQKLTVQLTNLWLRGNRITLRELRNMWENLRRRILVLHREMPRQNMPPLPSIYTRSLLERCMILTQMTDNAARTINRSSRNGAGSRSVPGRSTVQNREMDTEGSSNSNLNESEHNSSTDTVNDNRPSSAGQSPQPRSSSANRASSSARRRLQSRWRPEDELRRRQRMGRVRPRGDRREIARALEVSATRHEVRMRAMQVLSTMFNIMMMCLEERGLSQLIITMLRTLKKALALTCLMLMMNRNSGRTPADNPPSSNPDVDPLNVVRIQNSDHAGPVDVDGPDDSAPSTSSPRPNRGEESQRPNNDRGGLRRLICRCKELKRQKDAQKSPSPTTSTASTNTTPVNSPSPSSSSTQRWSNRLAVQIAAANRNTSVTARKRRDLYLETKRQKALHRTNPTAHPLIKKRVLPPVSTHRIPALRSLPSRINISGLTTPRRDPRNDEPVAGPSTAPTENPNRDSPREEVMNEFEQRVNLIRLAHLQAVRLRNAARTRYRRLQTIRLYTPSSVREMFELHPNYSDSSGGQNNSESGIRRSFTIRPHILTPRSDVGGRPSDEPGHFHTVLNNVAVPLMQVNDGPASSNSESQGSQPQRMHRIHEYLQPIILAQNAMVIDDEVNEGGNGGGGGGVGGGGGGGGGVGGGARRLNAGMAGLLDAGFISETMPAPSHRVQAWDFTTGDAPNIADGTKNVVVQRCRIHNDASIDISKDGRLLVALLPVPRLRNTNHWLGVYSLEWARLGQCLHTAVLEQSAVSVALSPTARHLAVGLGSRRFSSTPHARSNVFALLYRLEPLESSSRTGLSPIKELEQNWEQGFTSLNCLRWAPQPGQGLVYANNTGQLIIMS